MRGRNTKSRISESNIKFVKEHINSFNRVPAHYCRSSTSKEYLESNLNKQKMYDMYKKECIKGERSPVKKSMYNTVLNRDFNIGFHKPKKDRCDLCEEIKIRNTYYGPFDEKSTDRFDKHVADKIATKEERE